MVAFYSGSHIRTRFREPGKFYSSFGHRGQDIAGWDAGTPIPSYVVGYVVANYLSGGLGWVVEVRDDDITVAFCHMQEQSPLGVGDQVDFGTIVGDVGQTGSLADGDHLHTTVSIGGVGSGTVPVSTLLDPLPFIIAALTRASGGNVTPLPMPELQEDIVSNTKLIYYADSSGAQQLAIIGADPTDPIYGRVFIDWLHVGAAANKNPLGNGLTSQDVVFFYGPAKLVSDIKVWNRLKNVPNAIRTLADLHAALAK